jgi:hypothetical protein
MRVRRGEEQAGIRGQPGPKQHLGFQLARNEQRLDRHEEHLRGSGPERERAGLHDPWSRGATEPGIARERRSRRHLDGHPGRAGEDGGIAFDVQRGATVHARGHVGPPAPERDGEHDHQRGAAENRENAPERSLHE